MEADSLKQFFPEHTRITIEHDTEETAFGHCFVTTERVLFEGPHGVGACLMSLLNEGIKAVNTKLRRQAKRKAHKGGV